MTDFDRHFHTALRPPDANGNPLKPFDLVIIGDIPTYYYDEPGCESLRHYGGKYGLVTYFSDNEPFYYGRKDHPGWVSPDGSVVSILSRRVCEDSICSYDFWLSPTTLRKIPYNSIIMNVFTDLVWQMLDDEGPSDHHFIVRGMEQFEMIERILNTPYDDLARAHDAAMKFVHHKGTDHQA